LVSAYVSASPTMPFPTLINADCRILRRLLRWQHF
jgi:hypothetical protein